MKLLTANSTNGTLVTELNQKTIINHQITSGSKVNVAKFHMQARVKVFKQIKDFKNVDNIDKLFKEL